MYKKAYRYIQYGEVLKSRRRQGRENQSSFEASPTRRGRRCPCPGYGAQPWGRNRVVSVSPLLKARHWWMRKPPEAIVAENNRRPPTVRLTFLRFALSRLKWKKKFDCVYVRFWHFLFMNAIFTIVDFLYEKVLRLQKYESWLHFVLSFKTLKICE